MNIGELKHRISLITQVETKDADGFKSSVWTEVKKVWAKIDKDRRTRIVLNEKEIENRTLFFTIRYTTIDLEGYRIRYQGKDYEITNISDEKFEKRALVLSANEVV